MSNSQNSNQNPTGAGNFSENPPAQGVKPENLLSIQLYDESVTSTFTISRLFSLKKRKWLKPFRYEVYGLEYNVLPGRYLLIEANVHKRKDEIMKWSIEIVRIYKDESGEVKMDTEKEIEWITPIPPEPITVPILRDIERPAFHDHSGVDYNKIYTDFQSLLGCFSTALYNCAVMNVSLSIPFGMLQE